MIKLLIIDDELSLCDILKNFFVSKGYRVSIATNTEEGLSIVKEERPQIILLDIMMPGQLGISILKEIKKIDPKTKIIMLTVIEDQTVIKQAKKLGACDYITKPFSLADLEKNILPKILKQLI